MVHPNDQNHVSAIELTLVPSRSLNAEAFRGFRGILGLAIAPPMAHVPRAAGWRPRFDHELRS